MKGKMKGGSPTSLKNNTSKPKTPSSAIGRDGGKTPKAPSDKVERTKVSKSSLHRNMPD